MVSDTFQSSLLKSRVKDNECLMQWYPQQDWRDQYSSLILSMYEFTVLEVSEDECNWK